MYSSYWSVTFVSCTLNEENPKEGSISACSSVFQHLLSFHCPFVLLSLHVPDKSMSHSLVLVGLKSLPVQHREVSHNRTIPMNLHDCMLCLWLMDHGMVQEQTVGEFIQKLLSGLYLLMYAIFYLKSLPTNRIIIFKLKTTKCIG